MSCPNGGNTFLVVYAIVCDDSENPAHHCGQLSTRGSNLTTRVGTKIIVDHPSKRMSAAQEVCSVEYV